MAFNLITFSSQLAEFWPQWSDRIPPAPGPPTKSVTSLTDLKAFFIQGHNDSPESRPITLRQVEPLQSPADHIQVCCGCRGACDNARCEHKKSGVPCTLYCYGRDTTDNCVNLTEGQFAPSRTFNLDRCPSVTTSKNRQKRHCANTRRSTVVAAGNNSDRFRSRHHQVA